MCGIVGLYNVPVGPDVLQSMLDSIAHRGPDAAGTYEDEANGAYVRLGHRRLSIIDLSDAANQPFEKDGLVLVFNGEIYNYKALAKELSAEGVTFKTHAESLEYLRAVGLRTVREWKVCKSFDAALEYYREMEKERDDLPYEMTASYSRSTASPSRASSAYARAARGTRSPASSLRGRRRPS